MAGSQDRTIDFIMPPLIVVVILSTSGNVDFRFYRRSETKTIRGIVLVGSLTRASKKNWKHLPKKMGPSARYYGEKTGKTFKTLVDHGENGVRVWRVK